MKARNQNRASRATVGFSLLETLIASAILAIVALSMLGALGKLVRFHQAERTHWQAVVQSWNRVQLLRSGVQGEERLVPAPGALPLQKTLVEAPPPAKSWEVLHGHP